MNVISVIVGSTREGRFSKKPARWIFDHLKQRKGVDARLLDLRDFPMPFFDQPFTPATPGRPPFANEVVQRWTSAIAESDGFIIGVHFGQSHRIDDDGCRISGGICSSTGSPYPVVLFSRHQYERAPAMACDLDRPAACVSQKRFELASKLQNRNHGHDDRPVF
jgi:hypothetical protein